MSGRNEHAILAFTPRTDLLVEAYQQSGSAADFEQIVHRFAALVFNECRRVTKNPHDAEDAAQLTFLALAIELRSGSTIRQPGSWLSRVAKRQALKIVRSRGRRQRREAFVGQDEAATAELPSPQQAAAEQAVMAGIVRDAIDALPEHYRLPLVLHYFGGLKLESIANELGVSRQAVGTRLHRARKMIAKSLADRGIAYDAETLAGVIAFLVPAGVVAAIVRSTTTTALVPGTATSAATGAAIAHSVSAMLRATGVAAIGRPILTICATLSLSAAGGLAYVGPSDFARGVQERIELRDWIDWLFEPSISPTQFLPSNPRLPSLLDRLPVSVASGTPTPHDPAFGWPIAPLDSALPAPLAAPRFGPTVAEVTAALDAKRKLRQMNDWPSLNPPALASRARDAIDATGAPAPATPDDASDHGESLPDFTIAPTSSSPAGGGSGGVGGVPFPRTDFTIGGHGFEVPAFVPELDVGSPDGQTVHIAPGAAFHAGHVRVGVETGDRGTIIQDGGTSYFDELTVGQGGDGRFIAGNGAQLNATRVTLAANAGSTGTLVLYGGSDLRLIGAAAMFQIGRSGDGRLILGSSDGPGSIMLQDVTNAVGGTAFVVRDAPAARGLIRGWGGVYSSGSLVMNDRVVADGYGHLRTLDFSSFDAIVNTIDNPVDGHAGWYVRRGGRIALPRFSIAATTQKHPVAYTWGESSDDPTLDLVNSLRLTVDGQRTPATLGVSLRTIAAADPIDVPLPHGLAIFALWQFDASKAFDPSSLEVVTRYDDRLIRAVVGDDKIKLLAYIDGTWTVATGDWADADDRLIGGHFSDAFEYLAVAADYGPAASAAVVKASPASQTPEPATWSVTMCVATLATTRRRRSIVAGSDGRA